MKLSKRMEDLLHRQGKTRHHVIEVTKANDEQVLARIQRKGSMHDPEVIAGCGWGELCTHTCEESCTVPEGDREAVRAKKLRELAQEQWDQLDDNGKGIIRIGMVPIEVVHALEEYGDSRQLTLAMVECAKADGGMKV